ncbi:MAG: acetate/propionate family kinase [Acidobacteriota bacterium]
MPILALNAGSSSLKYAVFRGDDARPIAAATVDLERERIDFAAAAARVIGEARAAAAPHGGIAAVGHRVVHGGVRFHEAVALDATVEGEIARLAELAPLHNPPALAVIAATRAAIPDVPQAAAFDTAFFAALPPRAHVYPLPWEWYTQRGIRRFGFHGLSHQSAALRTAELAPAARRVVTCHLGQGCSAAAIDGTTAVATTMGYTPLEGLMMGSRSGSVDPGILLELLRGGSMKPAEVEKALLHEAGLLGVSGVSSDFRKVQAAADAGNARAVLALEMYGDRVRSAVASLASTLGGLDALVFTGGVGEGSSRMRAAVAEGLAFAGVRLDPERNAGAADGDDISGEGAPARVFVLRAREEWMIARETRRVTGAA